MRGDHGQDSAANPARLEAIITDRNSAQKGCLAGAGFPDVKIFDRQKGRRACARTEMLAQFTAIHADVHQRVYSGIADDGCWMSASILDTIQIR